MLLAAMLLLGAGDVERGALHAGWSTVSITPDRPVALAGQFHKRISTRVASPVMATALALETRKEGRAIDQALMISCDLVGIPDTLQDRLRKRLDGKLEGFDLRKLFINATHTHTAPYTGQGGWYDVTEEGVMTPGEYVAFLLDRLARASTEAWERRSPAGVNWGLDYAVVGFNRRMTYRGGRAAMYGRNNVPDFEGVEGAEDHGVETLAFRDADGRLTGLAVNVVCPSQEVEGQGSLSADFWHDLRGILRERHGKELHVLAWTGAAGDQSPHLQIRRRADDRMREKRGMSRLRWIAVRIADAVGATLEALGDETHREVPLAHHVETLRLPPRKVTEKEYRAAKEAVERLAAKPAAERRDRDVSRMRWHGRVVQRYEDPPEAYPMELHVLRLGEIAIVTNPFELFIEFGIRMKTRSPAIQTFVVELACATGGYLPTAAAVRGGGYSAVAESSLVGPEGGRVLVDRAVEVIGGMWGK